MMWAIDSILVFCLIAWIFDHVQDFKMGDDGNVILST